MMHFDQIPEPSGFDEQVRQPGNTWLTENPNAKRPRDLWSPFRDTLAEGFNNLCGYSVMWDLTGTVDHYLSCKDEYRYLAYEWSNYRYVSGRINSSKRNEDDRVLDPFQIDDDWFEVLLPSLQLVATESIPIEIREKATYTLMRLKLRDGEGIIRQRRAWYAMYESGELTLDGLERVAPLIARAVRKQQAENVHD